MSDDKKQDETMSEQTRQELKDTIEALKKGGKK